MTKPTVSLLVPIRNEERRIGACLDGIRAQTHRPQLIEILVIDGESTDGTRAIVEQQITLDHRIRLLDNPEHNTAHGLNVGLRDAAGMYIGYVNGHTVIPATYVARCIEALETTGAWSVGGRYVRKGHSQVQRAIALTTASPLGVGNSRHNYATQAGWVETVFPGFWRRELFETVGLFDPGMVANEDNELSYRVRKAGGRIWYDPQIAVEYEPRATFGGLFHQYRRYALGKIRVFRKHHGGLRWRHLVPGAWVTFLVAGAAAALLVPWFAMVWFGVVLGYLAVVLSISIRLSRAGAPWWLILAAFVTLHVAYGIGTWQGLLTWRA